MPMVRYERSAERRHGFTLVEMLVVVTITALFSTIGFAFLGSYRSSQNLKKSLAQMLAVVQATQKRSITQDAGARWGVRFSHASTTGSQYFSFSGASFSTSSVDRIYGLANSVTFSEPSSGAAFDALFDPLTGALPARKIVSLITGRGDGLVGDLVFSAGGRVAQRNEHGLIGYWHFDEGTDVQAHDAAGRGKDGTLTNSPSWQTAASCVAGACLAFNGSAQYVSVAPLNPPSSVTVTAWFKRTGAPGNGYHIIVMQGAEIELSVSEATGQIRTGVTTVTLGRQVFNAGSGITDGNWHHLAMSYDGATLVSFIDGQQVATNPVSGALATGLPVTIGAYAGYYAHGLIDEVRVYDRALSAGEIASQYHDLQ